MEKVTVSVIMGIYNPQIHQLKKAVTSIIRQSFGDWELLIYDDGSQKKYSHEIMALAKLDPRIFCYRGKENKGLANALNKCIKLARGKYIARMDCDDISLERRLEKQVDFLDNYPEIGWVGCGAYLMADGEIWGVRKMERLPTNKDFLRYSPYIHPTIMFRKEILELAGGYNTSKFTRRCEDYNLFMRLHEKMEQGYNLEELLFVYLEDEDSYKKRTLKAGYYESIVRFAGFRKLEILKPSTIPYLVRPVVGAIIPRAFLMKIKSRSKTSRLY